MLIAGVLPGSLRHLALCIEVSMLASRQGAVDSTACCDACNKFGELGIAKVSLVKPREFASYQIAELAQPNLFIGHLDKYLLDGISHFIFY